MRLSYLVSSKIITLSRTPCLCSKLAHKQLSNEAKAELNDPSLLSHTPVLSTEVLEYMCPKAGDTIIDMTFGGGGHTRKLLHLFPDLRIIAVDRDPVAYEKAQQLSEESSGRVFPLLARFSELPAVFKEKGISCGSIGGILFDLGCSSMQMDDGRRGFSISREGPLDMRMDGDRFPNQPTAADVLANIREDYLQKVLKIYGEEKQSKKIARTIIEARYLFKRLRTTSELAELVDSCIGDETRHDKLGRPAHCATKTFQALRIFINNEINELNYGLEVAHRQLRIGGRVVAISFHSLEDRVVKRQLVGIDLDEPVSKSMSQKYRNAASWHSKDAVLDMLDKKWFPINKHVITPSEQEIKLNPRARSAKLRAAIKTHN